MWLFYHYSFERNYDALRSNIPCILLNKNINFNKKKRNRKWKISHTVLEKRNLCFSSYKNRKLKVKLLHIKKHYFIHFFFFLKFAESLQCILKVFDMLAVTTVNTGLYFGLYCYVHLYYHNHWKVVSQVGFKFWLG